MVAVSDKPTTSSERSPDETVQETLTGEQRLTTSGTVLSAHVGSNAEVFPNILELHVSQGARVADVTYGQGTFWKRVPSNRYELVATDLDPNKSPSEESVDCRDLPYSAGSFDAVVLDPPYAAGMLRENARAGSGSHGSFRTAYTSDVAIADGGKYHEAVRSLYRQAGEEAYRVLRDGGTLIAKMQDEVVSNTQELTHIQVTNDYCDIGFTTRDLFVLVRENKPSTVGVNEQVHARKNHSYFMVYDA